MCLHTMKRMTVAMVATVGVMTATVLAQETGFEQYRDATTRIINEATKSDAAWQRLAEFTDRYPAHGRPIR